MLLYEQNKEMLLEKRKEKYTCECGPVLTKGNKSRHEKSKRHQDYLTKLTNLPPAYST